ncbi:aspartyl protease [bacterium]|nr:MAG: aspartyl protease [bacterium]
MGHTWIDIEISNLEKTKVKKVSGLVDTGATLTAIPKKLAEELAIKIVATEQVQTGAGLIFIEKGNAIVAIGNKECLQTIGISDIIEKVLIGCVTLETLGIKVNPVTGKLEETPLILYNINYRQLMTRWK